MWERAVKDLMCEKEFNIQVKLQAWSLSLKRELIKESRRKIGFRRTEKAQEECQLEPREPKEFHRNEGKDYQKKVQSWLEYKNM